MKSLFFLLNKLPHNNGISKKIIYQKRALEKNGLVISMAYFNEKNSCITYNVDDNIIYNYGNNFISRIKKRCKFGHILHYIKKK